MKPPLYRLFGLILVSLAYLPEHGCSQPSNSGKVARGLEDGVYEVVSVEQANREKPEEGTTVVEVLKSLADSQDGQSAAPDHVLLKPQPIVRLSEISNVDFVCESGRCVRIEFDNGPALKKFAREHRGSQLAVVMGNKVISSHKIRSPLESHRVQVTFCQEGSADLVRKRWETLIPAR